MRFMLLILLPMIVGCSREAASPKERFEAFVKDVQPKLGDVTYDVSKTDSLVSPFSATLNYSHVTEEDHMDVGHGGTLVHKWDLTAGFAFQKDKWTFTVLKGTVVATSAQDIGDESEREAFEQVARNSARRGTTFTGRPEKIDAKEWKVPILHTCKDF